MTNLGLVKDERVTVFGTGFHATTGVVVSVTEDEVVVAHKSPYDSSYSYLTVRSEAITAVDRSK